MTKKFKEYTIEEIRKMKSKTDIKKFNETSEKDIKEQILADPDLPNLTDEEMKEFDFPEHRDKKHD